MPITDTLIDIIRDVWTGGSGTGKLRVDASGTTVTIDTTGLATSGNQTTANTSLSSIDTKLTKSSSATESSVAASGSSVTILALNASRLAMSVYNDSTVALYLRASSSAASTSTFTVKIQPNGYWESVAGYTGQVTGIWDSATGSARVTEYV